jgi:hypothetical protein
LNLNIRLCRSTTEPSVNLTLGLINLILSWVTTSGSDVISSSSPCSLRACLYSYFNTTNVHASPPFACASPSFACSSPSFACASLAFERLRAKVLQAKAEVASPFCLCVATSKSNLCSDFYKNKNSSRSTFALALQPLLVALQPLLVALQRQERQERQVLPGPKIRPTPKRGERPERSLPLLPVRCYKQKQRSLWSLRQQTRSVSLRQQTLSVSFRF